MNRDLLEKPFEPGKIKQRKGRDGMLDYVEGHTVIARLNEAFDGQWSFEIMRHDILEERDEILVLGKLSADGVVKMQFGVSQITRDRETKQIVCLGDDLKAAGTDALKKCATFLGVGLHLYGERARVRPAAQGGPGAGWRRHGSQHPPRQGRDLAIPARPVGQRQGATRTGTGPGEAGRGGR